MSPDMQPNPKPPKVTEKYPKWESHFAFNSQLESWQ